MNAKEDVVTVDAWQAAEVVKEIVEDGWRRARLSMAGVLTDSLSSVGQNESPRGTYQLGCPLSGQTNGLALYADGFLALRVGKGLGTNDMASGDAALLSSAREDTNVVRILCMEDMACAETFMGHVSNILDKTGITLFFGPTRWHADGAYCQYQIFIEAEGK